MLSFPVFLHPKPRPAYPRRNDFTACFFRLSAPSSVLHLSPFFSSRFGTLASHSLHHGIAVNSFCFKHLRTTIFATAGWRGAAPRFLQVSLESPRPAPSACGDSPWLSLSTVKLSTADLSLAQALWVFAGSNADSDLRRIPPVTGHELQVTSHKFFRMRSYTISRRNSFRIRTYRKGPW